MNQPLPLLFGLLTVLASSAVSLAQPSNSASIDQGALCLECHDLEAEIQAEVEHSPVSSGECTACHNPHASREEALLLDRPAILCASCHAEVTNQLADPVVHEPVAEGRCTSCHEAHGGTHQALLVRPGSDLCSGCHSQVAEWRTRAKQHEPFERGRCATCHEPHSAANAGLAPKPLGDLCSRCHPVSAAFTRKHQGYPVERANCRQCHDPHASARPGLFRSSLHFPFEDGECASCHRSADAERPFELGTSVEALCGECHEDQLTEVRVASFSHVSGEGGCVECHNPHTADGDGLLKASMESLCTGCHDPGGSHSGLEGRNLSHGEGLACSLCHSPHGGERPLLMAADAVTVCGACHSHQHGISHPMGEESRDPRNQQAMDCLSCHGIHEAPSAKYLHAPGERELCVSCHKELGRQVR